MKHRMPIHVRFYELDPYGHVNHSVYIQYFEAARVRWLAEVGFPLDDELVVESELAELRRVSMTFEQRIRRGEETLVEQTITAACINDAGRPIRAPEDLIAALTSG